MNERYRMLLVDDDADLLKIFSRRFVRRGYDVTAVTEGNEARAALRDNEFHVAVIDRTLPDEDGTKLAHDLRELYPNLQVVLLTGHSTDDPDREAERLGVYAYLTKPCRLDELETIAARACAMAKPVTLAHA